MSSSVLVVLVSLMLIAPVIRVQAQFTITFEPDSYDYYVANGGQVTITGTLTAYETCTVSMDFWLHDLAQDWGYVMNAPQTLTIGVGSQVSIKFTVPQSAQDGTYTMVTLLYANSVHESSWFTFIHVNQAKLIGAPQEDHYYSNRFIVYENYPREIYGPNKQRVPFNIGFQCPQDYNGIDPLNAGERIWIHYEFRQGDDIHEGMWDLAGWNGVWCPKSEVVWLDDILGATPTSVSSAYWLAGAHTFRIYVTRVYNGEEFETLDEMEISVTIHCVSLTAPPTGEKSMTVQNPLPPTSAIHLESLENNSATSNYGIIAFDGTPCNLSKDISEFYVNSYQVTYYPKTGYEFDHWEVLGGISVSNASENPATATVFGSSANLKAIYYKQITPILGDVNHDGIVNMRDISHMVQLFNTNPSSPVWDINADVNNDGTVNMRDIMIAILNFGKHE